MAENTEDVLTKQIAAVVGDVGKYEDLAYDLASDVIWYPSWYGVELGSNSLEVQIDYGNSLQDLIAGNAQRRVLAATIRSYITMDSGGAKSKVNIDEVVRLLMERIINWKRWYPEWYEDQNYRAYVESEDADLSIYDYSDYGTGDNGTDYFG